MLCHECSSSEHWMLSNLYDTVLNRCSIPSYPNPWNCCAPQARAPLLGVCVQCVHPTQRISCCWRELHLPGAGPEPWAGLSQLSRNHQDKATPDKFGSFDLWLCPQLKKCFLRCCIKVTLFLMEKYRKDRAPWFPWEETSERSAGVNPQPSMNGTKCVKRKEKMLWTYS